jgi:hypothetical protein
MKYIFLLFLSAFLFLLGCATSATIPYYGNDEYKDYLNQDASLAPLLIQYRFVSSVENQEIMILNDKGIKFFVHVEDVSHAAQGFVINLPANHSYAIASLLMTVNKQKREIVLAKNLPLFSIAPNRLTRIRGFDIINDKDQTSTNFALAPWDPKTDNAIALQSAKRFNLPDNAVRTVDIFKR